MQCCYLKTGFLGLNLRLQCFTIAIIQTVSAVSLLIMASLMIHTPENFITDWDKVNKSSAVKFHYTNEIGQTGVEILVACLLTFIGAISLLLGITSNVSGFILPWILMNVGYYFASLGIFISRLASPIYHIGVLKVTAIICYHILMAYFILSVYSYYRLLKRQKILAQNILDLQFQGSNSSLNSELSVTATTELHTFPSSRPQSIKSNDSEDDDDEFILYLK